MKMKSYSFSSKDPSCKEPYHDSMVSRDKTNQSTDQKISVRCTVEPSIQIAESLMDLSSLGEAFVAVGHSPGMRTNQNFTCMPRMELNSEL